MLTFKEFASRRVGRSARLSHLGCTCTEQTHLRRHGDASCVNRFCGKHRQPFRLAHLALPHRVKPLVSIRRSISVERMECWSSHDECWFVVKRFATHAASARVRARIRPPLGACGSPRRCSCRQNLEGVRMEWRVATLEALQWAYISSSTVSREGRATKPTNFAMRDGTRWSHRVELQIPPRVNDVPHSNEFTVTFTGCYNPMADATKKWQGARSGFRI
jgi:hypothetical protein